MDAILFGLVMLAIPWLVAWTMADHSKPARTWWPFDIRPGKVSAAPQPEEEQEPLRRSQRTRTPPRKPWKRSSF